jgi:two-component system response regulator HydG
VLVVDDDPSACDWLASQLTAHGFAVSAETGPEAALESLATTAFDVVISDLRMESMSGVELCERVAIRHPDVPVILLTAHGDMTAAVAALRVRAFDFLEKPADIEGVVATIRRALLHRRLSARTHPLEGWQTGSGPARDGIIGASPPMRELVDMVDRVAAVDATVLVRGESGTGKDLVARAIHEGSKRRAAPFVALNCAAIPPNLLEAELFGHVKGAFTDARAARAGLFEQAHGGTLFLDEVGDLQLGLQPKLLRALQERAIRPIGSEREIEVDVRLITATNVELASAVLRREFRADLFYRLNVVEIVVPPLRDRGDDVLLLARHLLAESARSMGREVVGFTGACAARLRAYSWPGNVRELANVIERAVALTRWSQLDVEDLPPHVREPGTAARVVPQDELVSLAELERLHIQRVIQATGGNKSRAARILGVDRRTLYRKDCGRSDQPTGSPDASDNAGVAAAIPLRQKFLAHRRRDTDAIRVGIESGDFELVARLAHNMKGNGASYGFANVSEIGARMEAAAEAGDVAGALEELLALEAWLDEVGVPRVSLKRPESGTHTVPSVVDAGGGERRAGRE